MLDGASKKKLIRLINPNSFRFIVVLYENANDIKSVKSYIKKHFSLNQSIDLDINKYDYNTFSIELYSRENTFVYIDNFIGFLEKKELYEGFNQRRDKLAKYPINLIFFCPKAVQERLYKDTLIYMADLWEFRNGVIELADGNEEKKSLDDIELKAFSSLGGLTRQSKEVEILRLESHLESGIGDELRANILGQMGILEYDLGRYEKSLGYLETSIAIQEEIGDKAGEGTTLNNISTIYQSQGDYTTALEYLIKSLSIQEEIGDKAGEGATLNNISQIYQSQGDYTTALEYLIKSLAIREEIGDKAGICATLFNIGHIKWSANEQEKALKEWVKAYHISRSIGYAQVLDALDSLGEQISDSLDIIYDENFWDKVEDTLLK